MVIEERLLYSSLEPLGVDHLLIDLLGPDGRHAVSPKQPSNLLQCVHFPIFLPPDSLVQVFKHLIEVELPNPIHCVLGDVEETESVVLIDEAIRKDPQNFVQPNAYSLLLGLQLFLVRHADSEDHSGKVSQVEEVVRLSRGRQELIDCALVDLESRAKYLGFTLEDIRVEPKGAEEPLENGAENSVEGFVFERGEGSE